MLRPQDTSTRERKNLNGLWQFALDSEAQGRSARWFSGPSSDAREMAVPASFNALPPRASCGSAATGRASSPATANRRRRPMPCGDGGAKTSELSIGVTII
jgi:hypothetical protein